jgi:hypothetical protein
VILSRFFYSLNRGGKYEKAIPYDWSPRFLVSVQGGFYAYSLERPIPLAERAAGGAPQSLTLDERMAYQRAIEEVYRRHRLWPKENPQPKPPLDEVMPESVIWAKMEDSLRQSRALEVYWQRPITRAKKERLNQR